MNRVRAVLAFSLLAGGSGCAGLNRGASVHPPSETPAPAPVVAEAIDPFHPPAESPATRIARYFPGLSRSMKSVSATAASTGPERTLSSRIFRDRTREAVPRPDSRNAAPETEAGAGAEDEISTAAVARRGRRRPPRSGPETRLSSADRGGARNDDAPPPPLLAEAVVAEVDPDLGARHAGESLADRPRPREDRPASTAPSAPTPVLASTRRTPPMPDRDPWSPRSTPWQLPEVARRGIVIEPARPSSPEQDSEARQVRARSEDRPEAPASPLLALADDPTSRPAEAPAPAAIEARTEDAPREMEKAEDAPRPIVDSEGPAVSPDAPRPIEDPERPATPAEAPEADGPPPIEEPARPEDRPVERSVTTDPDTGGDPVLAGRPRMPRRDNLPPDLPPPLFPRTYYGDKGPAALGPNSGTAAPAKAKAERWTWKPRLFRRFRGE